MQNKRQKANQSSYRKQLIQLAKFYGIIEIKNYFKSAKRLTNAQIELILIKNKIKLPSKKTISKFGRLIIFKNKYLKQVFYSSMAAIVAIGFFGGAPQLIMVFHKIDYDLWKNKDEIAKHKNDAIDKILNKINNGVDFFQTQYVFDPKVLSEYMKVLGDEGILEKKI